MTDGPTFEALPLAEPLKRALADKGYTTPSPIQAQAIPEILGGRDIMGVAQTGTGKTAAFALPILHAIHEDRQRLRPHHVRALVLTPTRELAGQVAKSFETYGKHIRVSCTQVYGGVSAGPQIKALRRGTDVLVATPGRFLDLYEQGFIDISETEFFILDEADRMLDMGFIPDIRRIVSELPDERQSLFFSATLSSEITRLANEILTDPAEIRIAPDAPTADKVDHRVCFIGEENKLNLLQEFLEEQHAHDPKNLTLVFSRTKFGTEKLAKKLNNAGFKAESIHGNKSQAARQKALENFRRGRAPILVATDVAARGIDVKGISLVVNFDMPNEPESYVHRIGRTARAGTEGCALSFCSGQEVKDLIAVERYLKQEIVIYEDHDFHEPDVAARKQRPYSGKKDGSKYRRHGNGNRMRKGGRSHHGGGGYSGGGGGPRRSRKPGQRKPAAARA